MNTRVLLLSTRAGAAASFIRRLLTSRRVGSAAEPTDYQSLQSTPASVETEYQKLIVYHLRRWGVFENCATVTVRPVGQDRRGRDAYVAVVKLSKWERNVALRLLLGLPLFEKKVRKILQGSWLAEISHFDGLLLQTGGELQGDLATSELRHLVVALTGRHASARSADQPHSQP